VHQVYAEAARDNIPTIGQGGIETASDALEFLLVGSTAVGVGTALFYDPLVVDKINDGIEAYLERHGFDSVADLVGRLSSGDEADPVLSEYAAR